MFFGRGVVVGLHGVREYWAGYRSGVPPTSGSHLNLMPDRTGRSEPHGTAAVNGKL